jgi:transposase
LEELERSYKALLEQKNRVERENQELRQRLDWFIRRYFGGTKNEKISPNQLELLLQGLPAEISESPAAEVPAMARPESPARERRPRRALDDERLEHQVTIIEPPEVLADPEGWTRLGEERTTQLDYRPGNLFKHTIVRPRYVRRERFAIAPLPAQPIDKGTVGVGLLAWVLTSKFIDHLPLHRLAALLKRQHGVEIPRNTLAGWVEQTTELLRSVYRAMQARLRKRTYLEVDETTVRYLDPEVKGSSQVGYLWVYLDPGGEVLYQWNASRSHEAPKEFLGDYRGVLQVDGYAGYQKLLSERKGEIVLAHCWAHSRRKLVEASAESPRVSAWLLGQIQAMYGIERKLREKKAGPALRAAVRASQTSMVLERVFKAMTLLRARCLPGGALAKALDYSLERREGLSRFLGDGRIEIDSNLVENAIRPCAIGRKNWLFIGHPEAGDRAAIFYSIMASCRLHGVNAYDYLCDVLRRLPGAMASEVESFTPAAWAKTKRTADR